MLRSVGVLELSPSFSAIVIYLSSIPFSIYVCVILMNGCVVRTVVTWPLYSRVSRVSGPVILLFVYARQLPIFLFFRRSFAVSVLYVLTMDVAFGPEGEVPLQPSLRSDLPGVGLSVESACCVTDTRHRDASSKGCVCGRCASAFWTTQSPGDGARAVVCFNRLTQHSPLAF